MKYFVVVLIIIVFFTVNTTYASSPPTIDFEFVGLTGAIAVGVIFWRKRK